MVRCKIMKLGRYHWHWPESHNSKYLLKCVEALPWQRDTSCLHVIIALWVPYRGYSRFWQFETVRQKDRAFALLAGSLNLTTVTDVSNHKIELKQVLFNTRTL